MKHSFFKPGIEQKKARWGSIFVIPSILFFSLFSFYPIFTAIYTSLFKKKLLSLAPPDFIGLRNYSYLLQSPDFWNSIRATAVFTIGTFIPIVILSLILANFIVSRKRFQKILQLAYYSPAVLSSVVVAVIWLLIFDPRGLGNQLLNFLFNTPGVDHKFLANYWMVQISTMLVYGWKYVGYFTIIYIVGLTTIPQSTHEAARIDGASRPRIFAQIMLPLARPALTVTTIQSILWGWNSFLQPLIYLKKNNLWTLALGVNSLGMFMPGVPDTTHFQMALATIMVLPPVILYFLAQRAFVQGIVLTGLKG